MCSPNGSRAAPLHVVHAHRQAAAGRRSRLLRVEPRRPQRVSSASRTDARLSQPKLWKQASRGSTSVWLSTFRPSAARLDVRTLARSPAARHRAFLEARPRRDKVSSCRTSITAVSPWFGDFGDEDLCARLAVLRSQRRHGRRFSGRIRAARKRPRPHSRRSGGAWQRPPHVCPFVAA